MASSIDNCTLSWDYHADNFPISLMNMLKRKEFVDVTLVAGGHFFSAHRVVLSALSPYFQQMFTHIPSNQQAFVFLSGVPKETVEELITFIYTGKADVKYENLENFLSAAKALDIKGLTENICAQTSDVQSSPSNFRTPTYNAEQYQSTRSTIRVPSPAKTGQVLYEPMNAFNQQKTDLEIDGYNADVDNNCYGSNLDPLDQEYGAQEDPWNLTFDTKKNPNGTAAQQFQHENGVLDEANSMTIDGEFNAPDGPWNFEESPNVADGKPVKPNVFKSKRAKLEFDPTAYVTDADIRLNAKGQENIYFAGHKFNKHGKLNVNGQQRWQCTKQASRKCSGAIKTMYVDGILKMKVLVAEHVH